MQKKEKHKIKHKIIQKITLTFNFHWVKIDELAPKSNVDIKGSDRLDMGRPDIS